MNGQDIFFTGRPIWDLQYMLDTLSLQYPSLPSVLPDGIFGEQTLEAVMLFQRDFYPPVTGLVDRGTWDAIREQYHQMLSQSGHPDQLAVFPNGQFVIRPGESPEQIRLIQTMLSSLARTLSNFQPDPPQGSHNPVTVTNIQTLQHIAGLPETGIIDRSTWAFLTRLYHLFVTRRQGMQ